MVNFYHHIFHHGFVVAPRTDQAATGKHRCMAECTPASRTPESSVHTPSQQQPNPRGQPLPRLPTGQLVGQLLSQPWESFKQVSCICLKAHSHSGSSRKPNHSGGTNTSSNLWKQRRCRVRAQDSVTVGEQTNQPKTFLESALDSATSPTSPAAPLGGPPRSPQEK